MTPYTIAPQIPHAMSSRLRFLLLPWSSLTNRRSSRVPLRPCTGKLHKPPCVLPCAVPCMWPPTNSSARASPKNAKYRTRHLLSNLTINRRHLGSCDPLFSHGAYIHSSCRLYDLGRRVDILLFPLEGLTRGLLDTCRAVPERRIDGETLGWASFTRRQCREPQYCKHFFQTTPYKGKSEQVCRLH
jgi:hypothetical protein